MWQLKVLASIPLYLLAGLVKIIVGALGYIVIPIAIIFEAYEMTEERPAGHPKHFDGHRYNWTWKWMKLWDNFDDGIANKNYRQFDKFKFSIRLWPTKSTFNVEIKNSKRIELALTILYWSMIRNPANGLRTIQPYALLIERDKVEYVGSLPENRINEYKGRFPHWYFAQHGIYTCFFIQFYLYSGHLRRFWIGWKIQPQDKFGKSETDYRQKGAVFTVQFKEIDVR